MANIAERTATKGRVDSQMVQRSDIGSMYGGVKLEGRVTAAEAIELAGLNWKVTKEPQVRNGRPVPGHYWTVREDTDEVLGSVKGKYTPMQQDEMFQIVDDLVDGGAAIESAGALFGGKLVWMNVYLGDKEIVRGDRVKNYLLAVNTHDSSLPQILKFMPNRLACQNILNFSFGKGSKAIDTYKIRHTSNAPERMKEAVDVMKIAEMSFGEAMEAFKLMTKVKVDEGTTNFLLRQAKGLSEKEYRDWIDGKTESKRTPQWVNEFIKIRERIHSGPGSQFAQNTVYSVFQGINGYYDHDRTVKNGNENTDLRTYDRLFGTGAEGKVDAFQTCLRYAQEKA